jgi:hypothetical protein
VGFVSLTGKTCPFGVSFRDLGVVDHDAGHRVVVVDPSAGARPEASRERHSTAEVHEDSSFLREVAVHGHDHGLRGVARRERQRPAAAS